MAFLNHKQPIAGGKVTVGDFWQWAYSDILSNRNRSIFAEYIVGVALGVVNKPRVEWDSADLEYQGSKIEVKSSAYIQSWPQKKLSTIRYDIDMAIFYNWDKCKYEGPPTRCARIYVFCLYPEKVKAKADVLDVPAWDFYVVSTEKLNREFEKKKSLSLSSLEKIAERCKVGGLKAIIDKLLPQTTKNDPTPAEATPVRFG
jgi:hypothetical protein